LNYANKKLLTKEKLMKKLTGAYFCAAFILPAIVLLSCAGGAQLNDAQGKEWMLLEIKSQGKTVSIDRKKLEANNMGGAFTINFEAGSEGRINGMGAPNRYFAPYTVDGKNALSIGNIASTMMAAFYEPEELKEKEFFDYLSKASSLKIKSGKLEIYSANNAGAETVLIFETKKN
jgi:heat shock protein HslJ